jgi:peptidyl-prolyl cis-trans isomerase A (cyclophilin A)
MRTRPVARFVLVFAAAAAVAAAGAVAQEAKPKPPAAQTAKPKPPAAQTAKPKPKPPASQTAKPKPAAKPGTAQRGAAAGRGRPAALSPAARARLRTPARLKETAPATFRARFDSSVGAFVVEVHREWAPQGADRFYNLVKNGFYDGARFFRVMPNFMVQFGIHGDPSVQRPWRNANIPDDPVKQSNKRGHVTFATAGPNSRTTQIFINFKDNAFLDTSGFAPFGQVVSGMEAVDKINARHGQSPDQSRIQAQGDAYLTKAFPNLDYVTKATIVK